MAKATRAKSAPADVPVPQNRDEAAVAIGAIGQHVRERVRLEAAMADEIAVIRSRYEKMAEPHGQAITALTKGVEIWCAANRATLTEGGKRKTVSFPTGEVRWRMTPPKVSLKGVDAVLAALREMKLQRFIRTSEEVNKDAILADRDAVEAVPGITITQGEEFEVLPHADELAAVVA
jgi:phage host-nuclease inhibitor protein Gam